MSHPHFKIFKSPKDQQFYFHLTAKNGQIILQSEGYQKRSGVINGVSSVKVNASLENRYKNSESKDGQFYFNLHAGNGLVIGKSELYTSIQNRNQGIKSVQENGPIAIALEELEA